MRSFPALLAFTDGDVWRPGIGDPTVMGWVTVLAYFVVAFLCGRCAVRAKKLNETVFWGVLVVMMVLLGFNKQLDLQTFLTLTVRKIAIAQGWYEKRRILQIAFVGLVAITGLGGAAFMWRLVRSTGKRLRVALVGFVLLLCFVVVRAASFHHVDSLINFRFGGVRMNWVLELGAIMIIAVGTYKSKLLETRRVEMQGGSTDAVALS